MSYLEDSEKLSDATALSLNTGVLGILLLLYPIAAWLSDRPYCDSVRCRSLI
ncbi:hypothetical protein SynRS9909_00830 [Synechococcus sp. RS9909]|nr:hypothetical protein RS9917_01736 [Synechococcus sp. RS9917]QNI78822.1 hypothetical protein SynRS9909_00830 [Synechococcus sp. RS9909]